MWNPWNKTKEALAEVKRIGEQLEVVSFRNSIVEQAHKALVTDKAALEMEVSGLKTMVEDLSQQLQATETIRKSIAKEAYQLEVSTRELAASVSASIDANGVLSQLAQSRLDKLNSAKSILEQFKQSTSYLKSNKALRVELASAVKAIEEAKAVICPDQEQS